MANEVPSRGRGPASVFFKVLVTLSVMAALILVVVGTFIRFFYGSQLNPPIERLIRSHVELLAREMGDPPTLARARELARPAGFEVRYEGPGTSWSTSPAIPAIAQARAEQGRASLLHPSLFHRYHLVASRSGGTLLFLWTFGWAAGVHNELAATVLLLIVVFVLGAHLVIRQQLKPIRTLRTGVERLSDGDFSVQVPVAGSDEFATLSEAFNGMTGRIGEMMRARDQLLRDVSHELRSPITRMKLALEFIPDDEKKQSLEVDLRDMETMVVELLEIERLKCGGGLELEAGDLAALARKVVCEHEGRPPGVRLVGGVDRLEVVMDARMMRIVLKNLLENALKYAPPESRAVEVRVEEGREGGAVLRVSDEGPGVPPGDLERVFDPFYRVDRSRSKESGGYGLGLSLCKRIVEAHGGTIALLNNPSRGVTAIVTLPAARVP